jgi:hypothetical protein
MQPSQLDQLLKFLTETLQQGKDFTIDQAPQFVRELLVWRFYEAAFFIAIGGFVALIIGTIGASFIADCNGDDGPTAKKFVRLAACLIFAFALGLNGYTMVQVKVAPRVVIIEMVRDLISARR